MPPYSQESTLPSQAHPLPSLAAAAAVPNGSRNNQQQLVPAPHQQQLQQQQQERRVATGVINLGNTCYMNAVLQALAHSSDLCMAMDVEPHSKTCPIAHANARAGRVRASPSPDNPKQATRKSRRSSGKKSPSPEGGSSLSITDNSSTGSSTYCVLCEVEHHLHQVHSTMEPVAPSAFVHGFIEHVAPWFKLGVQEDSHEFLRLLIDAMQKSCSRARAGTITTTSTSSKNDDNNNKKDEDTEYPFQLFRGTVESNVRCESCQTSSSTTDPIEDIGLDVSSKTSGGKTTPPPNSLADVSSAFGRFARAEILEGYKCEKCGKVGKATKQSRLASIPPILTLHLKRFRYGSTTVDDNVVARGSGVGRREVSQLLPRDQAGGGGGKSGSAKIEGHVKFEQLFDLKPYMTESLQKSHKAFCRLFAVIVHAGTNSHSGHYISYVRDVAKNEWWKMDDARVSRVTVDEVMAAEAYMLFYRVVEHPTVLQLREKYKVLKATTAEQNAAAAAATVAVSSTSSTNAVTARAESNLAESKDNNTKSGDKKKRKRETPEYVNGDEWARAKTKLPPSWRGYLRRVEEFVSENIELKPEIFKVLMEEAAKKSGGKPPTNVCVEQDIQGGPERLKKTVLNFLYSMWKDDEGIYSKSKTTLIVPVVDANEPFL